MPIGHFAMIIHRYISFFTVVCVMQCMSQTLHGICDGRADTWSVLPVYGGGYVQNVVMAPSDTNVWYAYVDVGGPYRSDDAGKHWRALHGGFSIDDRERNADHVRSLSVDPRDADRIVIAGGNTFQKPGGIYISEDGGRTFNCRQTARFYGNGRSRKMYGNCIARNPQNPDELVAGEDWDGLFLSRDNGYEWRSVGPKEYWFTDIKYDLVVPGRIYACAPAISLRPHSWNSDQERKSGFWLSDDCGETWTKVSDVAPVELVQRADSAELLGAFGPRATEVRISRDGGLSWKEYGDGLPEDDQSMPWYFRGFFAFAATKDFWLVGHAHGDIFIRRPGDAIWSKVERKAVYSGSSGEHHLESAKARANLRFEALCSIVVDRLDNRHWVATDWHTAWESNDAGVTWISRVDGMMQLVSSTIGFDPFFHDRIHLGVADMGYFRSLDGGRTYGRPPWPAPYASSFAFSSRTSGMVFAAGGKEYGFACRSFDGGLTWERLPFGNGLPDPRLTRCNAYGVAVDPLTDDVYLSVGGKSSPGRGGIYRSRNKGESWEYFSCGLPMDVDLFRNKEFCEGPGDSMYFSKDGSSLLATRKIRRLWRLDRENDRWIDTGLRDTEGLAGADPHNGGHFIVCGSPVMESVDGGISFAPRKDLPDSCRSISFDAHISGLAVLGCRDGVWVSHDSLRSVKLLPGGLDFPSGNNRRIFVNRGRLFAFSSGSGVWTRCLRTKEKQEDAAK